MKKIIVLISLVAFLGVMAVPLSAATSTVAIEMVKDDKKADKKKDKKSEKAECAEKSDCCNSKCSDDKKDKKK